MTRIAVCALLVNLPLAAVADGPFPKKGEYVHAIAFSSNGKLFAATQCPEQSKPAPGTVAVIDTKTWKRVLQLDGPKAQLRMLAFVPSTSDIVAACSDGKVFVWDATDGKLKRTIDTKTPWITAMAVSPDGKRLAVVHQFKSTLTIWDLATGEKQHHFPTTDVIFARSGPLTFTPDSKRVAVAHMGPSQKADRFAGIREWDVETGKEAARYESPAGGLLSVAVSPDGKWLAAGMRSGALSHEQEKRRGDMYVWDRTTGKLVHTLNGGTPDMVLFLSFSPDSTKLYAATKGRASKVGPSGSGTSSQVHCWDIKAGKRLWIGEGAGSAPIGMAVSPDGSRVGLVDGEGVQIVDQDTGQVRENLKEAAESK
jgi:WD40 repeat protein